MFCFGRVFVLSLNIHDAFYLSSRKQGHTWGGGEVGDGNNVPGPLFPKGDCLFMAY